MRTETPPLAHPVVDAARRAVASMFVALPLVALALASTGCVVANPNHCVNRDTDGNAWCKAQDTERPFCNPCSAVNDGCQATEPQLSNPREDDFCFDYVSPGTTTGAPPTSTTDGDSASGTDGGTAGDTTGSDTTGMDITGPGTTGTDTTGPDTTAGDATGG